MKYKISANVIRRLPRYLRQLDVLAEKGTEKISSGELGAQLGLTPSQIRQDLNCFGGFGQQGYGYNVAQLREGIAAALGLGEVLKAVVVGAGNLGNALISNFRFADCGVRLLAAFDVAEGKVGGTVAGTPVYHASALETYVRENGVDLAVLTLPGSEAAKTAERLTACGVRGIWNFTGADLDGLDAVVENMHFSDSMLTLGYYMRGEAK